MTDRYERAQRRVERWRRLVDNNRIRSPSESKYWDATTPDQTDDRERLSDWRESRSIQRRGEYGGEVYHRFQLVVKRPNVDLFDGEETTWIAYPEGDTLRLLSTDFDDQRRLDAETVDPSTWVPQTTTDGEPIWAY